ncbi:hypothetical protein ACFWD7_08020 [Streptomyces mirabilis]
MARAERVLHVEAAEEGLPTVVDVLSLLLTVWVTGAGVSDNTGGMHPRS